MSIELEKISEAISLTGTREVFGVTGSGASLKLISMLEQKGMTYYPVAHEAAGALMAGAISRATKRSALSISIKGPGLLNALPGIASNKYENAPAISIAEAFDHTVPLSRQHKRVDQAALLKPVIKAQAGLEQLGFLPELLATARAEVPGPVHLDLGNRGATADVFDKQCAPEPPPFDRKTFEELLKSAQKIVVIAGSLALRRGWGEALARLRIPVFTTCAAKGSLDERAEHAAGVYTGDGRELSPETQLFKDAELVLTLGLRNTEILVASPFAAPHLALDEAPPTFLDGYSPALKMDSRNADALEILWKELAMRDWGMEQCLAAKSRINEALCRNTWLPAACFQSLNELAFDYGMVFDTGSFCTIGEHIWHARVERPFLGTNNGRFMGTGLPTAIGLSIANPGLPVFCATGDGGVRMYFAELKLAVSEKLPVCVVLLTDGLYGSVACVPQPKPVSSRAVTISEPSWWRTAEAMGCAAERVNSKNEFERAIRCWDRSGPLFIEAPFDSAPYAEMTRKLR